MVDRFRQPGTGAPRRRWGAFLLSAALFAATPAAALPGQPHEVVSAVIGRVLDRVGGSASDVRAVFEQELAPHLDFVTISRWLVGDRWETYGAVEQEELVAVIRSHIVRVYAALLARGNEVELSIEPNSRILTRSATVAARLGLPEGRQVPVEFRLVLGPDGWKLYDLVVEGLSFARSLRAELAPVIAAGGVAGLKTYLARPR